MTKTNPLNNTEDKQAKPREKVYKISDGKSTSTENKAYSSTPI